MVVLLCRRQVACMLFAALIFSGAGVLLARFARPALPTGTQAQLPDRTVFVIDAGHGGEDGGAVSADGTAESGINLSVALRLRDLLRLCGAETAMTRTEDVSIHSDTAETLHEKKASDLKNRADIVNGAESAVLVSIHQNCLPGSPGVHGAQVFYNAIPGAENLAESIQEVLNRQVNRSNEKNSRKIPSAIYLMNKIHAPGVLIECGFLSNAGETEKLQTPSYQIQLAAAIASGLLQNAAD